MASSPSSLPFWCWNSECPSRTAWPVCAWCCPLVFLYLLTFVQIGIYWVNHHYLVDEVETVSHGILWTNLLFLFCLSLFPFATEWIGIKGLVVVHHVTLCSSQYLPWAWIYGAMESDSFQEHRIGTRKLGQADRVRRTLPHSDSHGLLPACCLSGADSDRLSPLVAAAKIREPPRVRIASKSLRWIWKSHPSSGRIAIVVALGLRRRGASNGAALAGSVPVASPSPLTHAGYTKSDQRSLEVRKDREIKICPPP